MKAQAAYSYLKLPARCLIFGLLNLHALFTIAQSTGSVTVQPEPACQARKLPDYTASSLAPGGAAVYALPQLISMAEEHNPDAKGAWESVQTAAALAGVAKSALFPTLALSAYALRGDLLLGLPPNIASSGVIKLNSTIYEASVQASYSGDFGTNLSLYRASKHLLASTKASLNDTNQKVARDVAKKYYEYISDKESLRMSLADEDDSCLNLKESEVEMRTGLTDILSLKAARAKFLKAKASSLSAVGKVANAKIALAGLVGLGPQQSFDVAALVDAPEVKLLPENVEAVEQHALETSPQIVGDEEKIRAAHDAVRSLKRKYLPTFKIVAQGSYTNSTSAMDAGSSAAAQAAATNSKGPTYLYLGSLSWSIFDGGELRNEVKAAAAGERKLRDSAVKTSLQLQQDVAKSYNDVLSDIASQDAAAEALAAAKDAWDAAVIAKGNGLASELDVSKANLAYVSAQASYVQARASVLEDATELAYETGDLLNTGAESPAQVEVKHVP